MSLGRVAKCRCRNSKCFTGLGRFHSFVQSSNGRDFSLSFPQEGKGESTQRHRCAGNMAGVGFDPTSLWGNTLQVYDRVWKTLVPVAERNDLTGKGRRAHALHYFSLRHKVQRHMVGKQKRCKASLLFPEHIFCPEMLPGLTSLKFRTTETLLHHNLK